MAREKEREKDVKQQAPNDEVLSALSAWLGRKTEDKKYKWWQINEKS